MKAPLVIFINSLILMGCHPKSVRILGTYVSTCYIQTKPDVILDLAPGGIFRYKMAYLEENITGNWILLEDTLILSSDYFDTSNRELKPKYKYTNYSYGQDAFIARGKKLYIFEGNHERIDCFLKKQIN